MTNNQLTQIFTDIDDVAYDFTQWIWPKKIAYIVLKDNSILYTDSQTMLLFHKTDKLLYVASGITDTVNNIVFMPKPGVYEKENVERINKVIDFDNINHVVLWYDGIYFPG